MNISLPVKEMSFFIKTAKSWLSDRNEAKRSFEIRIANVEGKLSLSCGADSAFMEATIDADATGINQPFFLDMNYLGQYDFQTSKLTMIPPENLTNLPKTGIPRQVQFKAAGANFRIPLRSGDVWRRNNQDFLQFEATPGMIFTQKFLDHVFPLWKLPDSFNLKNPAMVKLDKIEDHCLSTYYFDGYGAFWHKFTDLGIGFKNNFKTAYIMYDFLAPYKKLGDFKSIEILQSNRQTVASVDFGPNTTNFTSFRWVEPNFHKDCPDVPKILNTKRSGVDNCMIFDAKSFISDVKRSVVFFSKDQQRKEPVAFNMVGSQYNLKGVLENSEMIVEGNAKQGIESGELAVQFQSGCLVDYLQCLDPTQDVHMEVLDNTTVLYQHSSEEKLLYWMPTQKARNLVNNS